jgi:chromosome segregation ATPase
MAAVRSVSPAGCARMIAAPSPDVLHSALAPVEELRGEHSQLVSSVRESFAALETLHDDLTEWQRELTREQAEFDQRAAAEADAQSQLAAAQVELQALRQRAEDLSSALEAERQRNADESRAWTDELRDMRRLLERHTAMLASLGAEATAASDAETPVENDGASTAESGRAGSNRRSRRGGT